MCVFEIQYSHLKKIIYQLIYWLADVLHIIYMYTALHVDQNNISYTAIDPISQLIPDQLSTCIGEVLSYFPVT